MLEGKVNAAIRLLSEEESQGVLPLDTTTLQSLLEKHPESEDPGPTAFLHGPANLVNDIIYQNITGDSIMKASLNTKGAAGPSGLDSEGWRRMLVSRVFGKYGEDLRNAVARLARMICTEDIQNTKNNQSPLEALIACRLIPLDKSPGVRPIGVGEVLRRIIGKSLMYVVTSDVCSAAGSLQLCAGQPAGSEAAIHAVHKIFEEDDCDAVILVDAANAFNSINRKAMLHNINILCPAMSKFANNCYRCPARLIIHGGGEIKSMEGTTQGDPIAMAMYAIGLTPMMDYLVSQHKQHVKSVAFADDLNGAGRLKNLLEWWKDVCEIGPIIGYYPKPSKSWVVVKPSLLDEATSIFKGTGLNVTSDGKRHLGASIGSEEYKLEFVSKKVKDWSAEVVNLTKIAKTDPHAAYTAFTHGLRHRYNYICRTIPDISDLLAPLEKAIREQLIPALTNRHLCNDIERKLLALPPKNGGLGIINVVEMASIEYCNSFEFTQQLQNKINIKTAYMRTKRPTSNH